MKIKAATSACAIAIAGLFSPVHAAFVTSVWQPPGNDPLTSSALVAAFTKSGAGEQKSAELSIPYGGSLTATAGSTAWIDQSFSLGSQKLEVDIKRMDRSGPSQIQSSGILIFEVTEPVLVAASGYLKVGASGVFDGRSFRATLFDLTEGRLLFSSIQDQSSNSEQIYELGGLVGGFETSFSGQLDNTLVNGHQYRLSYFFFSGWPEASDDGALGSAKISLIATPVPEPGTYALGLSGLALLGLLFRRRGAGASTANALRIA